MGLFSKKSYVCIRCGKTYEKRINLNGGLCDECFEMDMQEEKKLKPYVDGYCKYASSVLNKKYSLEEKRLIYEHQIELSNRFKFDEGISLEELAYASENYRSLTDEQAADVLIRLNRSLLEETLGVVYSDSFFVLTNFDGIIVDADDIFAVGLVNDYKNSDDSVEAIMCVCFSNDPYVPAFPLIFYGVKGFFSLTKSKSGREGAAAFFELMCKNLKYPVQDLKKIKKQIKTEDTVNGNIEPNQMLQLINQASKLSGIFNGEKMKITLSLDTSELLCSMGYIQETHANTILKMDKMIHRSYWNKQKDRLLKS